ncbi:MAG: cyclic pyranopterin monophosphate synthase MoaC [Elusimicrobiota bacterium]|nr:cyclic pyranopterin monophosphate synthase MoaC [Elusimicrobiota bacterium]
MKGKTLTHFNGKCRVRMVDITEKSSSERTAKATARILLKKSTMELLKKNKLTKGDALTTAKLAGILAAKKVSELIPLTHPISITHCDIEFREQEIETKGSGAGQEAIEIISEVKTKGQTGPDMEALVAVAIAALTIYDMVKSVNPEGTITDLHLVEKTGGKSGV